MGDCSCYSGKNGQFLLALVERELDDPITDLPENKLLALKKQIESCQGKGDEPRAKSGRKLSGYQIFLGECMRSEAKGGRGKPMMECIEEWKAQKNG